MGTGEGGRGDVSTQRIKQGIILSGSSHDKHTRENPRVLRIEPVGCMHITRLHLRSTNKERPEPSITSLLYSHGGEIFILPCSGVRRESCTCLDDRD